jgi:hypothetical protein
MTLDEMKQRLRASGKLRPENELSLDVAITEMIQLIWDAHDWIAKLGINTFTTAGAATWELPVEVDSILELTYGTNNRVVHPLPSNRITEIYDNVARSGSTVYNYRLYSTEPDQMTIEMIPTPASGTVFTYRFHRKIVEGDLSKVPPKLHPLVLFGTGVLMSSGDPYASNAFANMLARAIERDKPINLRRWTMGQDSLQVARVNARNSMMSSGTTQDTRYPTG